MRCDCDAPDVVAAVSEAAEAGGEDLEEAEELGGLLPLPVLLLGGADGAGGVAGDDVLRLPAAPPPDELELGGLARGDPAPDRRKRR